MPLDMDDRINVVDGKRVEGTDRQAQEYAYAVGKPVENRQSDGALAQDQNPDDVPVVRELRQ